MSIQFNHLTDLCGDRFERTDEVTLVDTVVCKVVQHDGWGVLSRPHFFKIMNRREQGELRHSHCLDVIIALGKVFQ